MRILVTGGAGFVGSNFVRACGSAGTVASVAVLDDFSTGKWENLAGLDVQVVEGSLLDPGTLDRALRGIDAVVHLGAVPSVPRSMRNPLASHAANATGTLELLEACRRNEVHRVVAASSSSVYGLNSALPKHEREWVRPMSPYAVSKLATEQYILAYQSSFFMSTLAFRFFNVYGPWQSADHAYAAVVPSFLDALFHDRPLPINGDGTQSRDFTYVGTVCEILLAAVLDRVTCSEPVNLAFGARVNLLNLVYELERVTGRSATLEYRPRRPGDIRHSQAENSTLKSLFPAIEPVALDTGLRHTADWFESQMSRGPRRS